jgi:hypothetical protein
MQMNDEALLEEDFLQAQSRMGTLAIRLGQKFGAFVAAEILIGAGCGLLLSSGGRELTHRFLETLADECDNLDSTHGEVAMHKPDAMPNLPPPENATARAMTVAFIETPRRWST